MRRKPLVLMYHGVGIRPSEVDPDHLFVPADRLRAQVEWLLGAGYKPLTLDEYLAGGSAQRSFLLTFDDGYASMRDAAGLLAELMVPSVCFILPGLWGGGAWWNEANPEEPLIDQADVRDLEAAGMRLELHGWDHTSLPELPARELRRQVIEAADAFSDVVHRRPSVFAYPYGHHDAAARRVVRETGVRAAFAVYDGLPRRHEDVVFAIPRVDVNSTDTMSTFRLKTLRAYPALRGAAGRAPTLRRGLHALIGTAKTPR